MNIPTSQRNALFMIAKGFKPRYATVEALFRRRLVTGTTYNPRLNDAGREFIRQFECPQVD